MNLSLFGRLLTLTGCLVAAGCNSTSQSARQTENAQYAADSAAKSQELSVAEGHYIGNVHLLKSNQDFQADLVLKVVMEPARSQQPENPSETVSVAKLSGSLSFPALDAVSGQDYSSFSGLVAPMGGFQKMLFDYGDYTPATSDLILPYSVSGYADGRFGQVEGHLNAGVLTATWFAKPFGEVATMTLTQVAP